MLRQRGPRAQGGCAQGACEHSGGEKESSHVGLQRVPEAEMTTSADDPQGLQAAGKASGRRLAS
ncbi:hypothetical protein NK6_7979 [Bradyrhizobium diazoefficiens]|uniref:Uncharacterized protein n=1 Tax=Bradyrhizobium diazoefficiens TaxID=1355477 RepID=A0A0E3VWL7_9BRAD|nr:hypothetical protein NK6_7979 [Bradyrhizobium diazoefficiens]